jgi:hypothetical protein
MDVYVKVGHKYLTGFKPDTKRLFIDEPGEIYSTAMIPGIVSSLLEQMRYKDIPQEKIIIEVARS